MSRQSLPCGDWHSTSPPSDPGLTVRYSPRSDPDFDIDGDASVLQFHRNLLAAGFDEVIAASLCDLDGEGLGDWRALLHSRGINALDGHLADVLASATADLSARTRGRSTDGHRLTHALQTLSRLGDGTVDGVPSTLADLDNAIPPLLADTGVTPTVSVRLGISWASRRRAQRERLLQWLVRLGFGARVELVVSEAAAYRIAHTHRAVVPAHVLTTICNRGRTPPAPISAEPSSCADQRSDTAAAAIDALDRTGRPFGVLNTLADSAPHALSYRDLTRSMALDSPPYEAVRTLASEYGVVERTDRADGTTVVSLRPAGLDVVRRLSSSTKGSNGTPDLPRADGGQISASVSDSPQNSPSMPYCPDKDEGGDLGVQTTLDALPTTDRPAGEHDAATADANRVENWQTGLITPQWAPRSRWVPAVTAASTADLSLVSADLDLDIDRDGRAPAISWDRDQEVVYAGAEYHNPMQAAVTLAHGLTCEQLWSSGEFENRIGEDLSGLAISDHRVLRNATRLGWFPNTVQNGTDVHAKLRSARDELLDLSRQLAHTDDPNDRTDLRAALASKALGLIGVVVHILDLVDVDVVLDYRIDDLSRHFSADGNTTRRADLVSHLQKLTAICSRDGAWVAYAQLLEQRAYVRADGWTLHANPGGDVATPVCSLVVHGGGVEQLEPDLLNTFSESTTVHPEAPPLRLDVTIQAGITHHQLASTTRRMLRSRGLHPTCTATAIVAGLFADPFGLAAAIHWGLARESPERTVYLDEIRRVLAAAGGEQLSSELAPSARAGIIELARAEKPLSQAELCRRAEISTQSWRNHRTGLVAADWIREGDGGWRLALPFATERHDEVSIADPPWWLQTASDISVGDVGRESRRPTDVLEWLLFDRGMLADQSRIHDPTDPIGIVWEAIVDGSRPEMDRLDRIFRRLGVPPPLIYAACNTDRRPPVTTTAVGPPCALEQTTLPISDTPQNSPST